MHLFKRYEQSAELMGEMMRQTGVDLAASDAALEKPDIWHAVNNCIGCRETDRCSDWLGQGHENATPPDFCPNAKLFETLTALAV